MPQSADAPSQIDPAAALSYPLLKKYVKRNAPDAELDLSDVDFGPGFARHEEVFSE